ncbi:NAD(P)-dependent dehydrogenase (short-subunit alcohol dehydrogenase family) [Bradyrhizobium sp. cir1]|uniref:SDR family NAD(P)-dependent oxidoreductase n=1 Tax=Bradyrhizobium sp. cir1 TaxID=1445730 RepID=UPI001606EA7B|nr:SDR family NAD(P)-dependent oxidoreductase [Bradyrhizobium sp. cir1]MBB4370503.1 NAD(P)-dependent dehydrogenase (short-subunit alcohol dehydrogenase family) [Bradyrhizobium sp. cir1]
MSKVIIVTGAANSIGRSTCRKLAQAGHTVYVSMRETDGHDELGVEEAGGHGADVRTIAFDISSEASVNSAIDAIVAENSRLDVIVHNARQVVYGPAEAFTPDQLAELYDTNVLSAQRLNRAALPQLRKQGQGLLIWISSSSARGGSVPFMGTYASSKAALDALALGYAGELARWGVETTIVVPSALGPGHYIRSGRPFDTVRAEEYADGPTADVSEIALSALAQLPAKDRTPQDVATAIADVVDMSFGQRPLRVHFGPDDDGAAAVDAVADRVRAELLRRIGLEDILKPAFIG